jgi:hypothetical protein
MKVGSVLSHRFEDFASLPDLRRRNGNGPPQPAPQSHIFRTGPAAPCTQHHHRVDVRGRPPPPLHDARRLWSTVPERVLISCHPYVGIDSAPASRSRRRDCLIFLVGCGNNVRCGEPKGFAAADHVGAARCSRRSRNLRHPYRQLPWLAEGRADALFSRPRLASRPRRAAGL